MATGSTVGIVIGVFVVIIIIFIFLFLLYRRQQRKLLFYKHQYFLRTGEYTVSMILVLHFFPLNRFVVDKTYCTVLSNTIEQQTVGAIVVRDSANFTIYNRTPL